MILEELIAETTRQRLQAQAFINNITEKKLDVKKFENRLKREYFKLESLLFVWNLFQNENPERVRLLLALNSLLRMLTGTNAEYKLSIQAQLTHNEVATNFIIEAIIENDNDLFEAALRSGANINPNNIKPEHMPLMLVIKLQRKEMRKRLLEHQLNVENCFDQNETLLAMILEQNDVEAFSDLISHHAQCSFSTYLEIFGSEKAPFIDCLLNLKIMDSVVKDKLKEKFKNDHGYTDLMLAVLFNDFESVLRGMHEASDELTQANTRGNTAFMLAVKLGRNEIIDLMLTRNLALIESVNSTNGKNVFMLAAENGQLDTLQLLLEAYRKLLQGNPTITDELLDEMTNRKINESIKKSYNNNVTAIYLATKNDHEAIVKTLLQMPGIELNAMTDSGESAMDIGLNSKNPAIRTAFENLGNENNGIDLSQKIGSFWKQAFPANKPKEMDRQALPVREKEKTTEEKKSLTSSFYSQEKATSAKQGMYSRTLGGKPKQSKPPAVIKKFGVARSQ